MFTKLTVITASRCQANHDAVSLTCPMPARLLSCLVMSNSVTPWTRARWAPLSLGFPGQNNRVGCRFLLQGIFSTQGLTLHLLQLAYGFFTSSPPWKPNLFCAYVAIKWEEKATTTKKKR